MDRNRLRIAVVLSIIGLALIGGAVLNWVYRLTVAVAIAGAVQYAARLVRRLRGARTTVTA